MFSKGQKVVCIQTHSKNIVVKGKVYTLRSVRDACCSQDVDVGVDTDLTETYCCVCGVIGLTNGVYWLNSELFRPIVQRHQNCRISIQIKEPVKETLDVPIRV